MAEDEVKVGDEVSEGSQKTVRGINGMIDAPVDAYEGAKNAVNTAKDTAKGIGEGAKAIGEGAKKAADTASKAANKIKDDGIKQSAQDAGNAIKGKATDTYNDIKNNAKDKADNIKNTAKQIKADGVKGNAQKAGKAAKESSKRLAQTVKKKAKQAPKKAANKAKQAATNLLNAILKMLVKKSIGVTVIGIVLCFMFIANAPSIILGALGFLSWHNVDTEHDYEAQYSNLIDDMKKELKKNNITIPSGASERDIEELYVTRLWHTTDDYYTVAAKSARQKDWLKWKWSQAKDYYMNVNTKGEASFVKIDDEDVKVTQDDLDELLKAKSYDEVLSVYMQIIDYYMNEDYEKALAKIEKQAKKANKRDSSFDVETTMSKIEDQGNPFSAVNYAAIISAYSCTTDVWGDSLARFKYKIKKGNFIDYDKNEVSDEKIIPVKLYRYSKVENQSVDAMAYYTACGDGTKQVRDAVVVSLNHKISELIGEKEELTAQYNAADTAHKNILKGQIEEINNKILLIYAKINQLNNDASLAKVSDIEYIESETITVDLYQRDLGDEGEPIVDEEVDDENGKEAPYYKAYDEDNNLYIKTEDKHLYKPEKKTIKYYEITWKPIDTTKCLEWFGLDGDDIAKFSMTMEDRKKLAAGRTTQKKLLKKKHIISIKEQYNEQYKTLETKCASAQYSTGVAQSYGHVYSEEEIKKVIEDLQRADPDIPKNRLQLVKTALSLCGRVMYQWGGTYADDTKWGWNKKWESNKEVGLDCSGFTQWVYRSSFCNQTNGKNYDKEYKKIRSTRDICAQCKHITQSQLKPGDLLTKNNGGDSNHVVMYIGQDKNGNLFCVNAPYTGHPIRTTTISKKNNWFCWRVRTNALEKDNYYDEEYYIPRWMPAVDASMGKDKKQIICEVLRQESHYDDGFRACAEASQNYAKANNSSIYKALTNKIGKSYTSAYTDLYVSKKVNPAPIESKHYQMLEDVLNGNFEYFGSEPKVQFWCSDDWYKKHPNGFHRAKCIFVKSIGGNTFVKSK